MGREHINAVLDNLLALSNAEVFEPDMPVDVYVQEADDQYVNCQPDKEGLALRGITEEKINSILDYSKALYEAECEWFTERGNKEQIHKEWLELSEEAHDLKAVILHDFKYAYRDNEEVLAKLKRIGDGSTHSDMIQDLGKLISVNEKFPEEPVAMNFNMELIDRAKEMVEKLGLIYARAKANNNGSEAKNIRDRAYTCLKRVIDEIRAAGQNLYWRNSERLQCYRSEYRHNINVKRYKKKSQDDPLAT